MKIKKKFTVWRAWQQLLTMADDEARGHTLVFKNIKKNLIIFSSKNKIKKSLPLAWSWAKNNDDKRHMKKSTYSELTFSEFPWIIQSRITHRLKQHTQE